MADEPIEITQAVTIPGEFQDQERRYDEQHGEDAFKRECWPIISHYGAEKWFDQPQAVQDARLTNVKAENFTGIDWDRFVE